jgi:hypothetical protein
MPLTVAPTLETLYTRLRALVVAVVPAGVQVVQGLPNGVSMPPASPGFVAMTAVLSARLRTNLDTYNDPAQPPEPPYVVGSVAAEMGTKITVQLDCYGATSGDWAAMLTTILRSEWGVGQLAPEVVALYAEDDRMAPLIDAERQYEKRWIVGAVLKYNPTTSTPKEYAGTLGAV